MFAFFLGTAFQACRFAVTLDVDCILYVQVCLDTAYSSRRFAVALDVDYAEQRVYFSDVQAHRVLRAFINGSGLETIVAHGGGPREQKVEGIAVDWIARS